MLALSQYAFSLSVWCIVLDGLLWSHMFSEYHQSKPASYTSYQNKFSDFLSSIIFSNYFQGNIATNYFQGNIATLKGRMLSLPLGITCFIQASSIMCAWNNVYFRCLMIFLLWSCNILMLLYFPELLIYLLYYTYVVVLNFSYIYRTTYSVAYCTKLSKILHLYTCTQFVETYACFMFITSHSTS
jgi:hypothetical protein